MRIVFFGAGAFGLPALDRLAGEHEVAAVVSQPDRPAGRRRRLTPTPAADRAAARGLETLKAEDVNDPEVQERIRGLEAEAAVVIAFGQKLGPGLLSAFPVSMNLHGSLLPRHRGAAPVSWAILAGDAETGVSVIELADRMDAGRIFAQRRTGIDPLETAGELHDRLAELGPDAVAEALDRFSTGELRGAAQPEDEVTRAPKLTKADGWLDLRQGAEAVRRRVHGLTPWPGTPVRWRPTQRSAARLLLRRVAADGGPTDAAPGTVLEAGRVAVGHGESIRLLELQPEGKRSMEIDAFQRGYGLAPGDRLEGSEADEATGP